MPSIADFHRAAEAILAVELGERKKAALQAELASLDASLSKDRMTADAFLSANPESRRLLEAHLNVLKRAGMVSDAPFMSRKDSSLKPRSSGPSRTAAATEAAAAKRRALREADPTRKYPRKVKVRMAHFDQGLTTGYRDRTENPSAINPHNKGDRAKGWALGARRADEDVAQGVVNAGVRADPPALESIAGRAEYEAELRTKAPE